MEEQRRTHYFIDKTFQAKFILTFCLIVLISSVLAMGFLLYSSRGSNTVAIENTQVVVKTTADFIFPLMLQTIFVVLIFASMASIAITLLFSHKISGPLVRLTREIDALRAGDLTRGFSTRGTDQLQKFSQGLFNMASGLKGRMVDLKDEYQKLKKYVEEKYLSQGNKEELERLLKAIEEKLSRFKTS